ncbi:hypothetical protein C7S16_6017 [Burkholderia thailandensis]|uniref:Uncharacterized protein n=1 Tax=Burkholderia thailandensis TaxID=57975 RepID=A0AAW9CS43_BURTH|nr:hypothetical protein [Burkholderia thailandensis]MDW9253424.1 hypothetical protein [Burkholderia thailandensis]
MRSRRVRSFQPRTTTLTRLLSALFGFTRPNRGGAHRRPFHRRRGSTASDDATRCGEFAFS